MSKPFLARRRRWPLLVLLAAAALVVMVAAGLVAEVALGPHPRENFRVPPPPPLPQAQSPAKPPGQPPRPQPQNGGPLQVIEGRHLAPGGISAGFPDTVRGAVSAAVQDWSQIASDLDPARAARIGRVIAARSWRHAPAEFAEGVRRTRAGLGLKPAGRLPAGTQVSLTAVEYQVRHATRTQVTVLLLAYFTVTVPGQQPQTSIGVYPAAMRWQRGDWKITPPRPGDYSRLDVQPGSARAAAAGWQPLDQ